MVSARVAGTVIIICSAADHQVCHSSLSLLEVSTESDNVR